jgi:mannose-6-phosphate isomerase-like protein (cupin superfamily)
MSSSSWYFSQEILTGKVMAMSVIAGMYHRTKDVSNKREVNTPMAENPQMTEIDRIRILAGLPQIVEAVGENKSKDGYKVNIEKTTIANKNFREVLYTSEHLQLVLMSIPPKEEIGTEIHPDTDQFFRIEQGKGKAVLNGKEIPIKDGDSVIVPAGVRHNFINMSIDENLGLYSVYAPPHHQKNTIHKTRDDALRSEEEFDGKTDV